MTLAPSELGFMGEPAWIDNWTVGDHRPPGAGEPGPLEVLDFGDGSIAGSGFHGPLSPDLLA